jgi:hypothetical protein
MAAVIWPMRINWQSSLIVPEHGWMGLRRDVLRMRRESQFVLRMCPHSGTMPSTVTANWH